jgi:hypothetical protein
MMNDEIFIMDNGIFSNDKIINENLLRSELSLQFDYQSFRSVMIKLKCKLYDYRAQKLRITSAMNNRRY